MNNIVKNIEKELMEVDNLMEEIKLISPIREVARYICENEKVSRRNSIRWKGVLRITYSSQ